MSPCRSVRSHLDDARSRPNCRSVSRRMKSDRKRSFSSKPGGNLLPRTLAEGHALRDDDAGAISGFGSRLIDVTAAPVLQIRPEFSEPRRRYMRPHDHEPVRFAFHGAGPEAV